ncbi:hypothetical protein HN587_07325 [Candidatus Woesearchaeota archaeon]|jgi:hypothetical protein|nr:hypothetical protein [Candidatus Woesearchaeota archaeon]
MKTKIFILNLFLFLILFCTGFVFAVDCPFGEVDCVGKCGAFVDSNHNGLCELSQETSVELVRSEEPKQFIPTRNKYNFIPLTLLLVVFYGMTRSLVKIKFIRLVTHQRIWNFLLLITFLISGLIGILLVTRINYGWPMNFSFNALWLHVETGIAMAIISVFHIAWHWKYFVKMFKIVFKLS